MDESYKKKFRKQRVLQITLHVLQSSYACHNQTTFEGMLAAHRSGCAFGASVDVVASGSVAKSSGPIYGFCDSSESDWKEVLNACAMVDEGS